MKGGRIIDATVIDISDLSPEEIGRPMGMQLILYKYEISGVIYEASQDVTLLKHLVNIYDCRLGFPASVRYDPHHPTNSIIIAEGWSWPARHWQLSPHPSCPLRSLCTMIE